MPRGRYPRVRRNPTACTPYPHLFNLPCDLNSTGQERMPKARKSSENQSFSKTSSSSLDRIETTKQTPPIYNSERQLHYESDAREFEQSNAVLRHIYRLAHPATIERLEACSSFSSIYYDKDAGTLRKITPRCHIRWCPICAGFRAKRISGLTFDWLVAAREPSFITLTLAHQAGQTLTSQITKLQIAFKKFRRDKYIKQNIRGGIWFLETKRGRDTEWHTHLHIAADSQFMPQRTISDIWLACTSDSKIIHIERIKSKQKMAAYVAKYCSKPIRLSDVSFKDAVEIVSSCKGKRLFGKWGTAAQLQFEEPKPEQRPNEIKVCSLKNLKRAADLGCYPQTQEIWEAIHTGRPVSHNLIIEIIDICDAIQEWHSD